MCDELRVGLTSQSPQLSVDVRPLRMNSIRDLQRDVRVRISIVMVVNSKITYLLPCLHLSVGFKGRNISVSSSLDSDERRLCDEERAGHGGALRVVRRGMRPGRAVGFRAEAREGREDDAVRECVGPDDRRLEELRDRG